MQTSLDPANIGQAYPYLQGLNQKQIEAVQQMNGPVLVLAGAGTGKTRALTTRLAHLLSTQTAFPGQILSVTFTNKAAQEMKERVSDLLGGMDVSGWWLGTFHSLSARMLRRHAELVGLHSNFTILDADDQIRLIKQLMESDNMDTKKTPPRLIGAVISSWKDKALRPEEMMSGDSHKGQTIGAIPLTKVIQLYHDYQTRLQTLNACDFGDLLLHMITIFKDTSNGVLDQYHARFTHVMVDEYQDTNVAQYLWLRLLAQKHKNICCVGDDDQSIYGWRGAEVGNILKFEKDFDNATVVRLEQNYRSTPHILSAANGLIAHNSTRLGKELWTDTEQGDKVQINGVWDGDAEARLVCEQIEQYQHKKLSLNNMAVLVRASSQMRAFEERFNALGLAYRVIGGPRFYERMEIRDALAYLRVTVQPDDDLALERIINTPKRGIGKKALENLQQHARSLNTSLYRAIEHLVETDTLRPALKSTLKQLITDFDRWRGLITTEHHTDLTTLILDESGYHQMWREDKTPEAPGRLENLKELVNGMADFASLPEFLEHIALVLDTQNQNADEKITLMTLHAAKGLEFDAVFLPGWEEGLFPSQRSMDEKGVDGLEEERRLAYVGITRARQYCLISHAANRRIYGQWTASVPSRFIAELPAEHVEEGQNSGMSSGMQSLSGWAYAGTSQTSFRQKTEQKPRLESDEGFQDGDRVFHQKFGYGHIFNVSGNKLDIKFDKAGVKCVIDRFIKKA